LSRSGIPPRTPRPQHGPRGKPSVARTWFARLDLVRLARALAIGGVGGAVFFAFNLPLAWMLGAMVFCTIASLAGLQPRSSPPTT
jgi:hypothetical protein